MKMIFPDISDFRFRGHNQYDIRHRSRTSQQDFFNNAYPYIYGYNQRSKEKGGKVRLSVTGITRRQHPQVFKRFLYDRNGGEQVPAMVRKSF